MKERLLTTRHLSENPLSVRSKPRMSYTEVLRFWADQISVFGSYLGHSKMTFLSQLIKNLNSFESTAEQAAWHRLAANYVTHSGWWAWGRGGLRSIGEDLQLAHPEQRQVLLHRKNLTTQTVDFEALKSATS